MFELLGESPEKAAADAKTVMKIETDAGQGLAWTASSGAIPTRSITR